MTNLRPTLLGVTIFFVVFNTLCVSLRCYVRACLVRKFGLDDWLLIVAAMFGIALGSMVATGVHHGLGRSDIHNMSLDQIEQIMKYQVLCNVLYVADTAVVKLSVAILLLRISPKIIYVRVLYFLIAGLVSWNLCVVCITLFQCNPISGAWMQYIGAPVNCLSQNTVLNTALGFSSVDIFYSFVFGLMPLPMLWNVQIPNSQKYGIWCILGLGLLSSIATAIRTKYIVDLNNRTNIIYTWAKCDVWSVIETGLAIVAASIAALRPLFKHLRVPGFIKTTGNGTNIYADGDRVGDGFSELMDQALVERSTSSVALATRVRGFEKDAPHKPQRGIINKRMEVQVEYERDRRNFDLESKGESTSTR